MKNFILFFFFGLSGLWGQQTYNIRGKVVDINNKGLESANIFIVDQPEKGVTTDQNGYFEWQLPEGTYTIQVDYLGFKTQKITFDLHKNSDLFIRLQETSTALNEIVINKQAPTRTIICRWRINNVVVKQPDLYKIPTLMGQQDILKAIQILPGVSAVSEGSVAFSVHGGSDDQNLILLDGAPLYHASHIMGFFSVFTPDVVKSLRLFKASIPASYDNRLSSVLDVKTKNGNMETTHYGGSVGLIAANLFVEGPIQKDKSSYFVSARKSYVDLYTPYIDYEGIKDAKLNFYDVNLKLNFDLSDKSKLQFTAYKGRDNYIPKPDFSVNYGNEIASLQFRHRFNPKFKSHTTLAYSKYDYSISLKDNVDHQDYVFDISLAINSLNLKQNFDYHFNKKNKLNFGLDIYRHLINPGSLKNNITGTENTPVPDRHAVEMGVYAQQETKIGKNFTVKYGLRASIFSRLGKETFYKFNELGEVTDTLKAVTNEPVKTFVKWAPRLSFDWQVSKNTSLTLSYDKTYQFLHYLINDATTMPTDLWLPSGINLEPQSSDSYSLEFSQKLGNSYGLSLGGFTRKIHNITDYRIGTTLSLSPMIEGDLIQGEGKAYGLEFLLKKTHGKFTGSLAYTYSRTKKIYPEINEGNWYPAAVDRPHDLTLLTNYKFNERSEISAMWVYYSGRPITYPAGTYEIDTHVILYFSHRNANRLPDYHRLDLSYVLKNKKYKMVGGNRIKNKYRSSWVFSIYNVYAYENTYMVKFKYDETTEKIDAYKVTLFKFIPSIAYNFKF